MISKAIAASVLGLCATVSGASTLPVAAAGRNAVHHAQREKLHRTVSIYGAVIRQLVTVDHTFGGTDPGFATIYVIDGAVEGAADPLRPTGEPEPDRHFDQRLKKELRKRLDDLPPLKFVRTRDPVITGDPPGHVINDGVLLKLGPIDGRANRVEVATSLWINGLAGQWLTYVIEHGRGAWEVAGTVGPVSIS